MKKIRQGMFETNSSSTHSFSIAYVKPLVEDGLLHYGRLVPIGLEKTGEYINSDWICICKTYEEKFSMLIHAIFNSSAPPHIKMNMLDILRNRCKYKVTFTSINTSIEMYDEEDSGIFETCGAEGSFYTVLNKYIDYAEDDTIMFRETFMYI